MGCFGIAANPRFATPDPPGSPLLAFGGTAGSGTFVVRWCRRWQRQQGTLTLSFQFGSSFATFVHWTRLLRWLLIIHRRSCWLSFRTLLQALLSQFLSLLFVALPLVLLKLSGSSGAILERAPVAWQISEKRLC